MSPTQMALRADTDMQSMVIDAYYLRNWNMYLRMVKYLRWSASVLLCILTTIYRI